MSALTPSLRWTNRRGSRLRRARHADSAGAQPPPRVAGRIFTVLLLMVLGLSLMIAVPALRPVIASMRHIDALWLSVAVALELASCLSFVALFRLFFDRLSQRDARALAWTEMASGALVPGGGAGGLAIGGWLMHLTGAPTNWIIRRSGGLFFLTSAVNSATVIVAGLLLAFGIPGPHAFTLTILPVLLAAAATVSVAALPLIMRSRPHAPRLLSGVTAGVTDAEQTTFGRPSWRLLGALGYLGFDMAVLWIILHGVGEPVAIPALVLAYNIGYLANTLPIPGGIGALDAGLAGSLLLYGAPPTHVAAAVLVYHAIALWIPGLGGTLAYLRVRSRLVPPLQAPVPVTRTALPPRPVPRTEPS